MSYLDQALHHPHVNFFKSERANEAVEFFAARGRFLLATTQKIVNIVTIFFKMVFIDSPAAAFDYGSGRQDFKDGARDMLNDLKALPIVFAGIFIGQDYTNRVWNYFHPSLLPAIVSP